MRSKNQSDIQDYIDKMKCIQNLLLDFLDDEQNQEEHFFMLNKNINDHKVRINKNEIKAILYLILNISNNHYRSTNFFIKIERVILIFRAEILTKFSNSEIFKIFKSNKRILLFLMENKLLKPDTIMAKIITEKKCKRCYYPEYFYPEFKAFYKTKIKENNEKFSQFEKKRKEGENDQYICHLIRNDLVEEFISYANKTNLSLSLTTIEPSIFETNSYLLEKRPTLIEYSAFFGSIQIFKYLFFLKVELTSSLWLYTIHSKNPELIHLLEEHIKPKDVPDPELIHLLEKIYKIPRDVFYTECIIESIKCHHNEITNYFQNTFIQNQDDEDSSIYYKSIKYYNYAYFPIELNNEFALYEFCKYDYILLIQILLKMDKIDINSIVVLIMKINEI